MKVVQLDHALKEIDQLLSTLDLLEMNLTLRINHAIKHKEDIIMDTMEYTDMRLLHMEAKIEHHEEKGCWLSTISGTKPLAAS
ncbi:hypothetical protein [Bacillus sp. 165]|uniref:hypothetical protein n=1 Tax=Bacillus sp. 165 TaxID=1529117 RepID=UPI001ADC5BC2|nr:hypothetical protein [Bacillus sp. 165]MBO9128205.1 hypothetical protein [Bacillus sp. 165]